MSVVIHQQLHGYHKGHQLLQSSFRLDRKDQDLLDQLSDVAGPLRAGEKFDPYISAYPLPSLQYYVLARTEQDLIAPRAGCVMTKSMLIPQRYWEKDASPSSLAALLELSPSDTPVICPDTGTAQRNGLAAVTNPVLGQLVEALFLEDSRAIVVFGAPSPEIIALRLLTAAWPRMRRSFSLCTFALSPRTLSGTPFDLVFAPTSARSRFAEWDGRRIETLDRVIYRRHHWTSKIEQRLFRDPKPTLLDEQIMVGGLVGNDDDIDEAVFRLSLLWEELRIKAVRSPTAVLGLIDIANSRNVLTSVWQSLEPAIVSAIENAVATMDPESAWHFLTTVADKLSAMPLMHIVTESFRAAGIVLTERDWRSAFTYLVQTSGASDDDNTGIIGTVANKLGAMNPEELTEALASVSTDSLIRVVALDDRLLARAFTADDESVASTLVQRLCDGFESLPPDQRNGLGFRILPYIRGDQDSALLAQIVTDTGTSRLVNTVERVWDVEALRTQRIGEVLCDAAIAAQSRMQVRTAFERIADDDPTNQCIEKLLVPDPADIGWLLESVHPVRRRTRLLAAFINRSTDNELTHIFNSSGLVQGALRLLADDLEQYVSVAARLILLPAINIANHMTLAVNIYSGLQRNERDGLGQLIARQILMDPAFQDRHRKEQVLKLGADHIDALWIINDAFHPGRDGEEISRLLVHIDRLTPVVRTRIEGRRDLIVELIGKRADFDLTADGAMALAGILERSAALRPEEHFRSCAKILTFALGAVQKPASPLVVASFPTVYRRFRQNKDYPRLMDFWRIGDWDRPRKMGRILVRAFLASDWPPVDLAVAAFRAGVLRRVLKQLMKEPGGVGYMDRIKTDTKWLRNDVRKPVLAAIKEVRTSG